MTCGYCWTPDQFSQVFFGRFCLKCGSSYHPLVKDPFVYPDTYAGQLVYPPKDPLK